jgi:hypothetical protein
VVISVKSAFTVVADIVASFENKKISRFSGVALVLTTASAATRNPSLHHIGPDTAIKNLHV